MTASMQLVHKSLIGTKVRSNRTELASQVVDKALCHSSMCQSVRSEIDGSPAGYGVHI